MFLCCTIINCGKYDMIWTIWYDIWYDVLWLHSGPQLTTMSLSDQAWFYNQSVGTKFMMSTTPIIISKGRNIWLWHCLIKSRLGWKSILQMLRVFAGRSGYCVVVICSYLLAYFSGPPSALNCLILIIGIFQSRPSSPLSSLLWVASPSRRWQG